MTKFEQECYEALSRLKKAAKAGSSKRITRETVVAEAGKKPGAIRPVRHPELCNAIALAESDRKSGLLSVNDSKKAEYSEALTQLETKLKKSEQERKKQEEQIFQQAEVMLNLINEISILTEEKESIEASYKKAQQRIDSLMKEIKPQVVK